MKITTFLMFAGTAEAAMNEYVALFPSSRIVFLERYGEGEAGKPNTIKRAEFEIAGLRLMCIDSPVVHAFTFTPATSLFIDCDSRTDFDRIYASLSQGGRSLMPPNNYGFSRWFAWFDDKYGVSWQLNVP